MVGSALRRRTRTGGRSAAAVRRHYEIERALADRLRDAPPEARGALYGEVYDELFRSVPDHPQLAEATDPAARSARAAAKLRLLGRFLTPETRLLEIGCGDGALSTLAAARVASVVAVDVSAEIVAAGSPSPKVAVLLTDGTHLPLPDASIDVAYSDQLIEHLHPDDAGEQLRSIARVVRPGGWYIVSTPNRLSGPHDVSAPFGPIATGLHLHEYTIAESSAVLRDAGFDRIELFAGGRGRYVRVPGWTGRVAEAVIGSVPERWRRRTARCAPIRALLGIHLAARRAS